MCEKCIAKIESSMDADNVAISNVDTERVRELLETVQGIAKRNNWPFVAHCCSRGPEGPSLTSLIAVRLDVVNDFAMMLAVTRRPEAGVLLDQLYDDFANTSEALTRAKAVD